MLRYIANHTKSLQHNNIHQNSPHAKMKTSACFVHYNGKTFQISTHNLTNANAVKCQMRKFSFLISQSLLQTHLMDHKMNTTISTYGASRPAHLNSKCAWHLTNPLRVLHNTTYLHWLKELASSGTSTSIAHHSHMLQAKEYPEDYSNSSTSPSHGLEAHDHPSSVENCHTQWIKYWTNLS